MIVHLYNIEKYDEENYAFAEIDVNNILSNIEINIDSLSKTIQIHFPFFEYEDEFKLKEDIKYM